MTPVRIATYNVHDWYDQRGRSNVDRIADLVNQLNPDILCLQVRYHTPYYMQCVMRGVSFYQEASRRGLSKFCEKVSYVNCHARDGCVILSNMDLEEIGYVS